MKTYEEMRARLAEQQNIFARLKMEQRDAYTNQWMEAIETKLEAAHASVGAVDSVAVSSNSLPISNQNVVEGAREEAAYEVQCRVQRLGYHARVDGISSSASVWVHVYWCDE